VAEINRTALPNFKFRWAENQAIPSRVFSGPDDLMDTLRALREAGLVKILAEPRVVTLSGRRATVTSGGQIPLSSPGPNPNVSYKTIGISLELLPRLKADGKIVLEARFENTWLDASRDITIQGVTPTTIPGFDTRNSMVTAELEPGKTLAIAGLS